MNYDTTIASLAKGMVEIADELPRIELTARLYASQNMKCAVTNLYAYIIQFSLRAFDWYRENSFWHLIHSFSRPFEVRYKDLIAQIKRQSTIIDRLAVLGQQTEQRKISRKLEAVEIAISLLCLLSPCLCHSCADKFL